jgi:hypothetical protein
MTALSQAIAEIRDLASRLEHTLTLPRLEIKDCNLAQALQTLRAHFGTNTHLSISMDLAHRYDGTVQVRWKVYADATWFDEKPTLAEAVSEAMNPTKTTDTIAAAHAALMAEVPA